MLRRRVRGGERVADGVVVVVVVVAVVQLLLLLPLSLLLPIVVLWPRGGVRFFASRSETAVLAACLGVALSCATCVVLPSVLLEIWPTCVMCPFRFPRVSRRLAL